MQHGVLAAAENRALVDGREVARAIRAGAGFHRAIAHDDEGGEVLIFAAEAIDGPGAERRAAGELRAAGAEVDGRGVVEGVAVATADDGQIIGMFGEMGVEGGDLQAGFAAAIELPRRAAHEGFSEIDAAGDEAFAEGTGEGLAVVLAEGRFGVEGIDVADAAVHEEEDDVFGLRRKVGRAGGGGAGVCLLFEQGGQGECAKAFAGAGEEFSA